MFQLAQEEPAATKQKKKTKKLKVVMERVSEGRLRLTRSGGLLLKKA